MAVVATGFFDGVHLGHRKVLDTLVSCAREMGQEAIVITFPQHPRMVLGQDAESLRLLNSPDEKRALLLAAGIDRVEYVDFTPDFAALTTAQYLRFLKSEHSATAVVIGYDNRIGSDQLTPAETAAAARQEGLAAIVAEATGQSISSTKIRMSLIDGDVALAGAMLGYRYKLSGTVVHGNKIGRTLGYPTANMSIDDSLKQIPGNGAYLVRVQLCDCWHWGMTNIGMRPTIGGSALTVETHILDFSQEIYGQTITIEFVARLRAEQHFSSLDELKKNLAADELHCREILNEIQ